MRGPSSLLGTGRTAGFPAVLRLAAPPERFNEAFSGFSGFSTVVSPQTAGVTDNPRPPPLGREQPIERESRPAGANDGPADTHDWDWNGWEEGICQMTIRPPANNVLIAHQQNQNMTIKSASKTRGEFAGRFMAVR